MVTTGPGGTNALTGVTAAYIESTPMIVLSGQVKRADMVNGQGIRQQGMQEVDIISMVKPVTKYAALVTEPQDIRYHLDRALYEAIHGRKGPVWLDIPLDVQASMIEETALRGWKPAEISEQEKMKKKTAGTTGNRDNRTIESGTTPCFAGGKWYPSFGRTGRI